MNFDKDENKLLKIFSDIFETAGGCIGACKDSNISTLLSNIIPIAKSLWDQRWRSIKKMTYFFLDIFLFLDRKGVKALSMKRWKSFHEPNSTFDFKDQMCS